MRLNVNRVLHTPDLRQDFHFEMDLSGLEFGGMRPIVSPVVVDGQVRNKAGVLLLDASGTVRRCTAYVTGVWRNFDEPKTVRYECVLAQERQFDDDDEIVLLENDEVDLARAGQRLRSSLTWTQKPCAQRTARVFVPAAA